MATHKPYDKVPELSLKQYIEGSLEQQQAFIEQLYAGIKHFGFIILKDHPISTDLLDKCYSLLERFYNLPTETKMKYFLNNGGQRGYTPFGTEHAKNNKHPDLKEFWHVGRDLEADHELYTRYPKNIWPDQELADFKTSFQELYKKLHSTSDIILEALSYSLKLPQSYFNTMTKDGSTVLRLLHYPPIPEDADPNCIRAAAHEDINLITILVAATQTGLELLDRDGKWLPVETEKNNLIVDAGDMLSRITNEVIPSTTHRVVNPKGSNSSRYSMPFFVHPHPEANLTCLPFCKGEKALYPDIKAEEFLMQRLKEIGLT